MDPRRKTAFVDDTSLASVVGSSRPRHDASTSNDRRRHACSRYVASTSCLSVETNSRVFAPARHGRKPWVGPRHRIDEGRVPLGTIERATILTDEDVPRVNDPTGAAGTRRSGAWYDRGSAAKDAVDARLLPIPAFFRPSLTSPA